MNTFIKDYLLAGKIDTPSTKLSRLAHSRHARVRSRVAENPATSLALLLSLSVDPVADVRIAVAANPKVPRALLVYLVTDENADVRYALAEDLNLAPTLLQKLSSDSNPYVAERAKKTMQNLPVFPHRKKAA